jgi:hypothetical protein
VAVKAPAIDTVTLLPSTAEAFNRLGLGDFYRVNDPERMAWVARVLRQLPDDPRIFPRGKWPTIQSIEGQVDASALSRAAEAIAKLVKDA